MKVIIKEMFNTMKQVEEEKAARVKQEASSKPLAALSTLTGSLGSAFSFGFGSKKNEADTDA